MSISSALSNALSGLAASSKNAQVVSANIANAQTPGYAQRSLAVSAQGGGRGGGVAIDGVTRRVDTGLLGDRRMADAELAHAEVRAGFAADIEQTAGTPDEGESLSGRLSAFEAGLITAAAKPEEETRLLSAVRGAEDLARSLNELSGRVQQQRTDAETGIRQAVDDANSYLDRIHRLNARIVDATNSGHPTASFEDQRRVVLDQLAELVPVRLAYRENGSVSVYSQGGLQLLDSRPAVLGFDASNVILPHMSFENGMLSGLTVNGTSPGTGGASPFSSGRIAGLFELRDTLATDAQAQVDAVARDLIARFQDPGTGPTRAPGDPGLFTDGGDALDPANETGIAMRISVNARVSPDRGGDVWRLRDGLGAVTPGDAGDATGLNAMVDVLSRPAALASGDLGTSARALSGHVASLASRFATDRLAYDRSTAFATAHQAGLVEAELSMGVDTDAELQHLLLIEQAYSANARIVQTVGEMIESLMRI